MDNITIPVDDIVKNGLSINEYLLLYNISNGYAISGLLDPSLVSLSLLEKKGFIKLSDNQVFLRDKAKVFFNKDEDLFLVWLKTYPTKVVKKSGGKRALSPSSPDTILGKRLKKKWREVLKNNVGTCIRTVQFWDLVLQLYAVQLRITTVIKWIESVGVFDV